MMAIAGGLAQWDWQLNRYYAVLIDGREVYSTRIDDFADMVGGLTAEERQDLLDIKAYSEG